MDDCIRIFCFSVAILSMVIGILDQTLITPLAVYLVIVSSIILVILLNDGQKI